MPRTYKIPRDLPEDVQAAMTVFNINTLRAAIIRDLAQHPEGETTGAIAKRIGVDYRQVYTHIRVLLTEGLVVADGDVGDQNGRRVLYRIDQAELKSQSETFTKFLAGK